VSRTATPKPLHGQGRIQVQKYEPAAAQGLIHWKGEAPLRACDLQGVEHPDYVRGQLVLTRIGPVLGQLFGQSEALLQLRPGHAVTADDVRAFVKERSAA
jgi:hypothetical protein